MKNHSMKRISFGKIPEIIEAPDLLNIQLESWESFLQTDVTPGRRRNKGLQAVFKMNFPITDARGRVCGFGGRAMGDAKVSLEKGLAAGAREGTPISAKFELEDGKLQLSVYTMKGDKFSEVIVDHGSGKVAKSEPITSGDDLTAAQEQRQAMAQAKRSLAAATAAATKGNPG